MDSCTWVHPARFEGYVGEGEDEEDGQYFSAGEPIPALTPEEQEP